MTAIRAIFDGKVFVPQQPLDIPPGTAASVLLSSAPSNAVPKDQISSKPPRKPLAELAKLLDSLPDNSDLPSDFASEIDHYLYGMPRAAINDFYRYVVFCSVSFTSRRLA